MSGLIVALANLRQLTDLLQSLYLPTYLKKNEKISEIKKNVK